jgi:nicotinate-nucleotide adenylyltransferase
MVACDVSSPAACRTACFPSIFLVNADTPEVSSTEVRCRAAAGEPLIGLVPEVVARYIAQHHLYA